MKINAQFLDRAMKLLIAGGVPVARVSSDRDLQGEWMSRGTKGSCAGGKHNAESNEIGAAGRVAA